MKSEGDRYLRRRIPHTFEKRGLKLGGPDDFSPLQGLPALATLDDGVKDTLSL